MLNQFKTIAVDSKQESWACCKYVYDSIITQWNLVTPEEDMELIQNIKLQWLQYKYVRQEPIAAQSATVEKASKMNLSNWKIGV